MSSHRDSRPDGSRGGKAATSGVAPIVTGENKADRGRLRPGRESDGQGACPISSVAAAVRHREDEQRPPRGDGEGRDAGETRSRPTTTTDGSAKKRGSTASDERAARAAAPLPVPDGAPAAAAAAAAAAAGADSHPDCPICQAPVGLARPDGGTEGWSALPCGHRFGNRCIKFWMGLQVGDPDGDVPRCPVCRRGARHACRHPILPRPCPPPRADGISGENGDPQTRAGGQGADTRKTDAKKQRTGDAKRLLLGKGGGKPKSGGGGGGAVVEPCWPDRWEDEPCAFCQPKLARLAREWRWRPRSPRWTRRCVAAGLWLLLGGPLVLRRRRGGLRWDLYRVMRGHGGGEAWASGPVVVTNDWSVDGFQAPEDPEWRRWWSAQEPRDGPWGVTQGGV